MIAGQSRGALHGVRSLLMSARAHCLGLALLLSACAAHAPAQDAAQRSATDAAAARASNSYAIYSMLLPGPPFDALPADQVQRFAIADTTVNITDMNPSIQPDGALQPPPDNPDAFREALHDFQTRRFERLPLTRQFHLDRDYTLLNAAQVAEFRSARSAPDPGSSLQQQYAGYPGITYFSQVFFNRQQTAALVYRSNWCANLCAAGQWIYLEKRGSAWVRRSGAEPHP